MSLLSVKEEYLLAVKKILNKNLPADAKVYAFGSRVTGTAKIFSDLDLAIDLGRKLTLSEFADLREDFDNTALPYTVDIVDLNAVESSFKEHILSNCVTITT